MKKENSVDKPCDAPRPQSDMGRGQPACLPLHCADRSPGCEELPGIWLPCFRDDGSLYCGTGRTGEQAAGQPAAPSRLPEPLDLFKRSAACLRQTRKEDDGNGAYAREYSEGAPRTQCMNQCEKGVGNENATHPQRRGGDGHGSSANVGGEDLGHIDPRSGAKAGGEGSHKKHGAADDKAKDACAC